MRNKRRTQINKRNRDSKFDLFFILFSIQFQYRQTRRDVVGLVPDHPNRVTITIKE